MRFVWFGLAIAAIVGVMIGCAATDVRDWIKTSVPTAIQKKEALPPKLSVREAGVEYEKWIAEIEADSRAWKESIEKGERWIAMIDSLQLAVFDAIGPTINGVPILGALVPAIAAGIGFSVRRPGDVTTAQLAKEKEKSFNAATEKATATFREMIPQIIAQATAGGGVNTGSVIAELAKAIANKAA